MEHQTEQERRRLALAALVANMGRGALVKIGNTTGKGASYISRLISDPSTKQHRTITGEMVISLDKHYPGWQTTKPGDAPPRAVEQAESVRSGEYLDAAKTTARLIAIIDTLDDDGLQLLVTYAETLARLNGKKRKPAKTGGLPIRRDDGLSGLGKIKRKQATGTGQS